MKALVNTVEYSDFWLQRSHFIRLNTNWIEDGFLVTQYEPADKSNIIEIGGANGFIYCMVITSEDAYANFLVAEAYNYDFIKDKELVKTEQQLIYFK